MAYFRVANVLDAASDLVDAEWLIKTDGPYSLFKRSSLLTTMNPIPTVDDLLQATHIGNGLHHWHVEGGAITITRAQLTVFLEAAYGPSMENWPALVEGEIGLWLSLDLIDA